MGWAWVGTGLFAWSRDPGNRIGMLMAATGFAWLLSVLGVSDIALLFTFGQVIGSVFVATALHVLLSAPDGRLHSAFERRLVASVYALTISVVPIYFFADTVEAFDCEDCPDNVLLIWPNKTVVDVLSTGLAVASLVLVLTVAVVLVRRYRRAPSAERRTYGPLYLSGAALMVALVGSVTANAAAATSDAATVAWLLATALLGVMPFAFLGALAHARVLQGGAVGALISRLGEAPRPGQLREALADALSDPSLELVYWLPESARFVDVAGRPYAVPRHGSGRAVAPVERDGETIAAIVYDASLTGARDHVRAVGAAAALALQNERLDAELRAKVEELRDSRERMLRIGLEERRRLERNLHDGAQQRLVSLALDLKLARSRLREDPEGADALLAGAGDELGAALEELRELARGLHPALLSERGLRTALGTLAARAPVPVELDSVPSQRLPEAVELATYFVVSEALTNVAKYAGASQAAVSVKRVDGRVEVAVADDGVGGADPAKGSGLLGLADRLAVIEGRLEVQSKPGDGTTVKASIPCA